MQVTVRYPMVEQRVVDAFQIYVRKHPRSELRRVAKMMTIVTTKGDEEQHEIVGLSHCLVHTHCHVRGGGEILVPFKVGDRFDYRNGGRNDTRAILAKKETTAGTAPRPSDALFPSLILSIDELFPPRKSLFRELYEASFPPLPEVTRNNTTNRGATAVQQRGDTLYFDVEYRSPNPDPVGALLSAQDKLQRDNEKLRAELRDVREHLYRTRSMLDGERAEKSVTRGKLEAIQRRVLSLSELASTEADKTAQLIGEATAPKLPPVPITIGLAVNVPPEIKPPWGR